MQKLIIEFSDERLITPSGLSLVGQMLGKSNFIKKCLYGKEVRVVERQNYSYQMSIIKN